MRQPDCTSFIIATGNGLGKLFLARCPYDVRLASAVYYVECRTGFDREVADQMAFVVVRGLRAGREEEAMPNSSKIRKKSDVLWDVLTSQANALQKSSPLLAKSLSNEISRQSCFADALSRLLSRALDSVVPPGMSLDDAFADALRRCPEIIEAAATDLEKLDAVNPACPDVLTGFLSFRGFQGLQLYRLTHAFWVSGERQLAVMLQNWGAIKFAMDIHPAARIGKAIFIDHGMGLVVGSTSVLEDGVNIWHGVTLGSTLTQAGDRHPKIRRGATLCAGATILGNIEIGAGAIVAASSVVLKSVEAGMVVGGIPAKVIGMAPASLGAIDAASKSASTRAQEI